MRAIVTRILKLTMQKKLEELAPKVQNGVVLNWSVPTRIMHIKQATHTYPHNTASSQT